MYVIHFSLPVMTALVQALISYPEQPLTELPNSYLVTSAIQPFIPLQKPNTKMPQDTIPLLKTFYRLYMTKFKLPCMLLKISKILLLPKSSSSIIPATPCLPLYASGIQNCLCVPRTHTMFPSSGLCCSLSQQWPASALTPHHPKPDEILIILFSGAGTS